MTEALDKLTAHFARRKNRKLTLDLIDPETGQIYDRLDVYYSPLGLADRQKSIPRTKSEEAWMQAEIVVKHSKDANGKPLFGEPSPDVMDTLLASVDPAQLDEIAQAILTGPAKADAEKN